MRVLIQRVSEASVSVRGRVVGEIGHGLLLLVGIGAHDGDAQVGQMAAKVINLRIFEDDGGRMNRSALDLLADDPESAQMLVVSQFTLYADVAKGRRPSFLAAAGPERAAPLIDAFADTLAGAGFGVERGEFGAEMAVRLINDGPVTIWIDSEDLAPVDRGRARSG